MSMSKKDYELIANVLAAHREVDGLDMIRQNQTDELVERFCVAFKNDNPSFRSDLFTKATRAVNPKKVMRR